MAIINCEKYPLSSSSFEYLDKLHDINCPVAVICTTFNQVSYIRQCLDSLVNQKTSFNFKIVIHDDASTDGTTEVVLEYAKRFPNLIESIIQPTNVYSKGIPLSRFIDPHLSGCKYVAVCEGDDWWLSEDKLQKQYDYMESNPNCSLCVHNTKRFDETSQLFINSIPGCRKDRLYSVDDVIVGGGGLFGTSSMFYRRELRNKPSVFNNWGIGDYPTAIWLSMAGKVFCFHEELSCYRVNAKGSWTSSRLCNFSKAKAQNDLIISGLKSADEYSKNLYSSSFRKAIEHIQDDSIFLFINSTILKSKRVHLNDIPNFTSFFLRQETKQKLFIIVKIIFPSIYRFKFNRLS